MPETLRPIVPAALDPDAVGIILTEIENGATIEKDVVTVASRLKLEVLGQGWHEAPLRIQRRRSPSGWNSGRFGISASGSYPSYCRPSPGWATKPSSLHTASTGTLRPPGASCWIRTA